MLKGEKEEQIVDYLREQGVTPCKCFKIKKVMTQSKQTRFFLHSTQSTFRNRSKFSNPLHCFNCQRFGHHENNCPVNLGSVSANCGAAGHDHYTSACKNKPKCVNCGKEHVSRSNECEVWKKEKEIMKIKTTKNITYLEAKKLFNSQSTDLDFSKIVHSLSSKPETKTTGTQFFEKDCYSHQYKSPYPISENFWTKNAFSVSFKCSI